MNVCRTCLKVMHQEDESVTLEEKEVGFDSIRNKLVALIPELNLEMFENSVICIPCLNALNVAHDFKIKSLETEQKIIDLKQSKGYNDSNLLNLILQEEEEEEGNSDIKPTVLEDGWLIVNNQPCASTISFLQLSNGINNHLICKTEGEIEEGKIEIVPISLDNPRISISHSSLNVGVGTCDSQSIASNDLITPEIKNELKNETNEKEILYTESCQQVYNNLESHIEKSGKETFICYTCEENFSSKNRLKIHIMNHMGIKVFVCDMCEYHSTSKSNLNNHLRTHKSRNQFQCEVCLKGFYKKSHLNYHMIVHTGEKPFQCNICNRTFTWRSCLRQHMHVHSEEKPFHCQICPRKFSRKHLLIHHVRSHTGEKPFTCKTCDLRYSTKGSLIQHLKTHMKLWCEVCQKHFDSKQNLMKHETIHTGKQLYYCSVCSRSFKAKHNCKSHMKIHFKSK